MLVALDKNGKRTSSRSASKEQMYFCPICAEQMVFKKGDYKIPHFAHINSSCTDSWSSDISEWHLSWQELFPEECREVVKTHNGIMHRADVLIEEKKQVIEFQHSPLSFEEFDDRNSFYTSLGYKVVWIFDFGEDFDCGKIYEIEGKFNTTYRWKYPRSTFCNYNPKNKNVSLYFEFGLTDEGKPAECKSIVKVVWFSDDYRRFAIDDNWYDENAFVVSSNQTKKFDINDVCNDLYNEHSITTIGHSRLFHGCPLSKNGFATSGHENLGNEYGCCFKCPHYADYYRCKYPLDYLSIPNNASIIDVAKNDFGLVSSVIYESDGKTIKGILPNKDYKTKSIFDLWDEIENPSIATFINLKTGKYVCVTKDSIDNYHKNGVLFGKLSSSQYSFGKKKMILYGCDKPEWYCVWFKATKN